MDPTTVPGMSTFYSPEFVEDQLGKIKQRTDMISEAINLAQAEGRDMTEQETLDLCEKLGAPRCAEALRKLFAARETRK